jgi:hypothetical protein
VKLVNINIADINTRVQMNRVAVQPVFLQLLESEHSCPNDQNALGTHTTLTRIEFFE